MPLLNHVKSQKDVVLGACLIGLISTIASVLISYYVRQWFYPTNPLPAFLIPATLIPALVAPVNGYLVLDLILQVTKAKRRIEIVSQTDGLTQLNNRRHFTHLGEAALTRMRESEGDVAVLLLDVDDFKAINDTYGHQAGDRVLEHIGAILKDEVRDTDIVGRHGGEEFAIVLTHCQLDKAEACAERIRERIHASPLSYQDNLISLSVSVGAVNSKEVYELETLLDAADKSMYKAKNAGKNRVSTQVLAFS